MGNALTRLLGRGKDTTKTAEPADDDGAAAETGAVPDCAPEAADEQDQQATDEPTKTSQKASKKESEKAPKDKPTDGSSHSRFGAWLSRPMTSFHLIIAIAGLLTTLGLIMVLSASGVRSYDATGRPG